MLHINFLHQTYSKNDILTSYSCLSAAPSSPPEMIELRTSYSWRAHVHKSLLCHYSTYYEAAIFRNFYEATRDYFTLDLDKNCADWFVRWLYSGQLGDRRPQNPEDEDLYRLYIFADEKDILALRRTIMTFP
jgi:hypothetical protein